MTANGCILNVEIYKNIAHPPFPFRCPQRNVLGQDRINDLLKCLNQD